ncbi:hypothetical protein [Motilimonas eburnea]|uniref:hypothetical protein n=1 Tax=Motilimonas eburnea TaxID=1737488 RepID=UPI001E63A02C|nr:hypothetical protein [Motilimonas eburnea]MCE2570998.1 hypothetical protein [Motilimonas eburnea]
MMMQKCITNIIACCFCGWVFTAVAGSVTIQKRSEISEASPDPWQIKQQILADNQWREWLKTEQGIRLLYQLPVGCVVVTRPMPSHAPLYHCLGHFYRSYTWQNQDVFVEVSPPELAIPALLPQSAPNQADLPNKEKGSNKP